MEYVSHACLSMTQEIEDPDRSLDSWPRLLWPVERVSQAGQHKSSGRLPSCLALPRA